MRRVAAGVVEKLQQPRLLFWRRLLSCGRPFLLSMPPVRAKCHPFLRGGASPRSRGEKKYFNIYLKVSAGNGISPSLSSSQSDYGNPGYGSARFSVFSLSTNTRRPSNRWSFRDDRIQESEEGRGRLLLSSFRKRCFSNGNLPRRNSISLSGVGCEVWARWRRGKIEVVTLGWIGRSLVDRFRQGRHRGTKSYYTR